mmetsp:Transcript_29430/g.66726  ORF Transcript_29430/g.66726 Transcript_29430/m.66726 type:complete len:85 (+) Transcript_29430:101-355(+)
MKSGSQAEKTSAWKRQVSGTVAALAGEAGMHRDGVPSVEPPRLDLLRRLDRLPALDLLDLLPARSRVFCDRLMRVAGNGADPGR